MAGGCCLYPGVALTMNERKRREGDIFNVYRIHAQWQSMVSNWARKDTGGGKG